MYVSIINFTYYNLYGGMMRGNYYINITLHFLYFHSIIIVCLQVLCTNIIINVWIKPALCNTFYISCCGENKFNSIK